MSDGSGIAIAGIWIGAGVSVATAINLWSVVIVLIIAGLASREILIHEDKL